MTACYSVLSHLLHGLAMFNANLLGPVSEAEKQTQLHSEGIGA